MTIITDMNQNPEIETKQTGAGLGSQLTLEARLNTQSFLIEILFYHMFKDQQASSADAMIFFNQLRRVPVIKKGDPFIATDEALPFVEAMDEQLSLHRDHITAWLKSDEDKAPVQPASKSVEPETQKEDLLPTDLSFEDVQNFVADELEDLIDNQDLKDRIKGIFGHD